jgi:hypothetical protein
MPYWSSKWSHHESHRERLELDNCQLCMHLRNLQKESIVTKRVPFGEVLERCELGYFQLIHSGLQSSRSADSKRNVCRARRGRSEHACNCVLNEAEAASPAEGSRFYGLVMT